VNHRSGATALAGGEAPTPHSPQAEASPDRVRLGEASPGRASPRGVGHGRPVRRHGRRPQAQDLNMIDHKGPHRARITVGERICRVVQRPLPGWVAHHRAVHHGARGSDPGRSLARGAQHVQASLGPPGAYAPGGSSAGRCFMTTTTPRRRPGPIKEGTSPAPATAAQCLGSWRW
jgi:hypothetical protein